jgi:sirohydrochlorin cobaltochelatase
MTTGTTKQQAEFDHLEIRLRTILPEQYQDSFDDVQPVSMGSAGLKYAPDGTVAWDTIWGSFCDLAMAGGPPHKGTLLAPGTPAEIAAQPERYREVVDEICRGITLVTGLCMYCTSAAMAGWLARAIVMENVSASFKGLALDLPAGPAYRIEKEIKNVITSVAKTCHYWLDHTAPAQHQAIADLLRTMESESPLLQPTPFDSAAAPATEAALSGKIVAALQHATGLTPSDHRYAGWLGIDCGEVRAAVWMMRVLVVSNVFSRREGTLVFLPLDLARDPDGATVTRLFLQAHRFAVAQNIFSVASTLSR